VTKGYCGLGRTVTALGLDSVQPIEVDCVVSRLNTIDTYLPLAEIIDCPDCIPRIYQLRPAADDIQCMSR